MLHTSSGSSYPAGAGNEIPGWAYTLVRLGSSFARQNRNNTTDFLVLLVPTRSFAAVFLATGMVLEDQLVRIRSTEDHFQWLCSLPPGTIVENGKRQGTIMGVDRTGESPRLELEIRNGRHTKSRSTFPCHSSMEKWLPKNSLRPDKDSLHEKLTKHLVTDSDKWFISVDIGPTVVICGERKILIEELNSSLTNAPETGVALCLDDILLANEYQYQKSFRRTRIESQRAGNLDLGDLTEQLVIYDGGRAFINRSHDFRGTDQILVLEYGDSHLDDAIEQIGAIWLDRVNDNDRGVRLPAPPEGCEMAHFQVRQ